MLFYSKCYYLCIGLRHCPPGALLALKQPEWEPRCLLLGKPMRMLSFGKWEVLYKAQDTENGYICRSNHAVYKATTVCLNNMSAEAMRRTGLRNNTRQKVKKKKKVTWTEAKKRRENRKLLISDIFIQSVDRSVSVQTELPSMLLTQRILSDQPLNILCPNRKPHDRLSATGIQS